MQHRATRNAPDAIAAKFTTRTTTVFMLLRGGSTLIWSSIWAYNSTHCAKFQTRDSFTKWTHEACWPSRAASKLELWTFSNKYTAGRRILFVVSVSMFTSTQHLNLSKITGSVAANAQNAFILNATFFKMFRYYDRGPIIHTNKFRWELYRKFKYLCDNLYKIDRNYLFYLS